MIEYPRGRILERSELSELVGDLASRPAAWGNLVSHDPSRRFYKQLWRDDHVTAWLICWMQDHDTGFHDHDLSSGAVAVAEGHVCEERLVLGGRPTVRSFGPGETFDFAASDIHRVVHAGLVPAVTLHAYSPPLWRMGAYAIQPGGLLARHSVSYAEELRPLEVG